MRNHKNVNAIKENTLSVISGFRREVAENWAIRFLNPQDGPDRLSRNVSKKLPLLAA